MPLLNGPVLPVCCFGTTHFGCLQEELSQIELYERPSQEQIARLCNVSGKTHYFVIGFFGKRNETKHKQYLM